MANVRQFDRLTRLSRRQPWLGLFLKFIDRLRIDSKEVAAEDDRGSKLDLWMPQVMALEQIAEGMNIDQRMFLILKGRQQGLCLAPSTRVLTGDLRWVPAGDLRPGDEIVCTDENPPGGKGPARKMRTGIVEAVSWSKQAAFRLTFDDGREVVCSIGHRWLGRDENGIIGWRSLSADRRPDRLCVGDYVRWITKPWSEPSYEDGWLGGMIDGEGSFSTQREQGVSIAVTQKPGIVWNRLLRCAADKGFNPHIFMGDKPRPSKLGSGPVYRAEFARMNEIFQIVGQSRPTRSHAARFWEGRDLPGKKSGIGWARIVRLEYAGDLDLVDLQTDHKTFIAEGFVSHNSTITLALFLFWVAVHPRTIAALVCNTEEVRDAFRNSLERYHQSVPDNFFGARFAKVRHNSTHFSFANGSRIDYLVAGRSKVSWGESRGYSVCLCTEVADYGKEEGIDSFIEALAQENPDRLYLFESTAKGPNHWQGMWNRAEDEPTIGRIFLGWWAKELNRLRRNDPRFQRHGATPPNGEETDLCNEVRERFGHIVTMEQLAWWRWKLSQSDRQSTEQNNPWLPEQAFVLSGYSFFETRLLDDRWQEILRSDDRLFKGYRFVMGNSFWAMRLERIMDADRTDQVELKIYEDPVKEGIYAIGCDPAFGRGETNNNHAIVVMRCYADKVVQVAEYADNRHQTNHCAWVLAGLAGAYRNCMVNLELYGPGRIVMNEFDNIRQQLQQEMYQAQSRDNEWDEDFMIGARWFMYRRVDNPGPGFVYNFETTARRKFELFNMFRDYFTSKMLVIKSLIMLNEMNTMVQSSDDIAPQSPGKQKDDRPFAAALAVYAWDQWIRQGLIAQGATYDRVRQAEAGIPEGPRAIIDRLVFSYFSGAEQEALEREDAAPMGHEGWKMERGLI